MDLNVLYVTVEDPQGDSFNWSIETSPDVGFSSGIGEFNGTKTCFIFNLNYDTTYTWFVNTTDMGSGNWTNETYSFTTELLDTFDPFNSGWQYRKAITINHTKVTGDSPLLNFPVLIDITDTDLSSKAQDDGDDIIFMSDTGV